MNLKLLPLVLLPLAAIPAYAELQGKLETANCDQLVGWAWDSAQPQQRVKVDIYDISATKTKRLATLTANQPRKDLKAVGQGDGRYGFAYWLPVSLRNAKPHQLAVRFHDTGADVGGSPRTTATACYGKLNDTGIQTCSDGTTNGLACPVTGFVGQDGDYGRDAKARTGELAKQGGGNAGFDFTKIANDASKLPASAALGTGPKDWACTLDNLTGLMWEVKTDDGGLRDKDNYYSWYNPDPKTNGGFEGKQNGGVCTGGIACDTQAYAQAVNAAGLCGKKDWRLPNRQELQSIVNMGRFEPAIDSTYFPYTTNEWYWSSSSAFDDGNSAWWVSFNLGFDYWFDKIYSGNVRLVRNIP